ncbi:MAG: exo-alpha-sialidase [Bacteroidetes bacterium]|nr:exo-alpha-sialidase [Bacteroidota bacterium]
MKKIIIVIIVLLSCLNIYAQQKEIPVFISGTEGYKCFRIPTIISLSNGNLLAFCEGRVQGINDYGNIDIVMKRSSNGGKTWSPLQVVAENGDLQAGNPAPVVDMTDPDYPQGVIFLFYNTGNNNEGEILKGNGIKYCLYKTSVDMGATWSIPVDITEQVHRLKRPAVNAKFNFAEDWRYYANTPGHAMQFQSGKYKGRIFVAANHSFGDPQKGSGHYVAHGYYTDDHGKTFKLGSNLNLPGSNESIAVELSNDRLMMNSRNQKGDIRERIVSISSDGGASWDTTYFDHTLIDPACQGTILNIGKKKGKNILAFCNAASINKRDNLTLRISFDEGKTWAKSFTVYKSQAEPKHRFDFAAYSDLVKLNKKRIGVLFEKDNYSKIVFTKVKWK